jgi:hypothetical protein
MEELKAIMQGIAAIFVIVIFITTILPELGKATGQNVSIFIFTFILLAFGVVFAIIADLVRK